MSLRARPALTRALKGLALAGGAGVVVLALAWRGWLPGSHHLRSRIREWRSADRIATFARESTQVPPGAVVFLGSSTISGFPFARTYPAAPWLNRGISSETTPQLIDRLPQSLPLARPAGLVLYTGANELRTERAEPHLIAARVAILVDLLHERLPDVPIAIVEIMPVCNESPADLARLAALNELLRRSTEGTAMAFVPTNRPPLTTPTGALDRTMSNDGQHLNDAGYTVLAAWIASDGGPATAPLRAR